MPRERVRAGISVTTGITGSYPMRTRPNANERLVQRRSGFGLLDMVMTLLVMSIVLAIAAPRVSKNYQRIALNAAAERLVSQLNTARALAVSRGASVRLSFTSSPAGFTAADSASSTTLTSFSLADDLQGATLTATFGSQSTVVINVYGTAASSGTVVLRAQGNSRTISISNQTAWRFVLQ